VRAAIYIITMLVVAGVACALAAALREVPLDERALGAASAGALLLYALYLARDWVLDLDCCTAPYHRRRAREVFRRIDRIDVEDGEVTTEQMRAVLHANGVGPQPRACAAPSTPVRRV